MVGGSPAFRELDLPDVEAFRAAVSEETLAALRGFTHSQLGCKY